jgi:metallophosphoesterase superfamily enzyme
MVLSTQGDIIHMFKAIFDRTKQEIVLFEQGTDKSDCIIMVGAHGSQLRT